MSIVYDEDGYPVLDHDYDYEDIGQVTTIQASEVKVHIDRLDAIKVGPAPLPIWEYGYRPGGFYPPGTYPSRRK